nr:unnamed protein product [Callosobruchus chinensis]
MFKFSASPSTTTLFGGNKSDSSTPSKTDATAAPLMFSFGSKASSTPQTTAASQPVATQAQTQSTPVFSFGGAAAKSSTESTKPVFGTGMGTATNSASSATFGSTAAAENVTLFAASSTSSAATSSSTSSEPAQKAAMFQFGQSASTTSAAPASATSGGGFNFNPAAGSAAPSFNFGAGTTQTAPAFNFGASQPQQPQQASGGADFKFGAASMCSTDRRRARSGSA